MKKKGFQLLAAAIFAAIALMLLSVQRSSPELFYFQNQSELHAAALQILHSGSSSDISVSGVARIHDWHGTNPIIEFTISSFGLTPSSQYKGLYYSPNDVPAAFQNTQQTLIKTKDGWTWTDEHGNHGNTTRIDLCWYTFEAYF